MEILYNRLFRGLQECFPKEEERKEHIMHNMLYMMDIQENLETSETKRIYSCGLEICSIPSFT